MEKGYQTEKTGQIYSAVMTFDARLPTDSGKAYACKSCQCNCILCRGHRAPVLEEMSLKLTEKTFRDLVSA